jgi:uncharacterized protein YjbI with pentapeptide repeats
VGAPLLLLWVLPAHAGGDRFVMDDDYAPSVTLGPWARGLKVEPGMNASGRCLRESKFICQDLTGAVFDNCDVGGVLFHSCDLAKASFKGAHLTGGGFTDCRFTGADFTDAIINGPVGADLSEEQLKSTRSYRTKDLRKCLIASYTDREPEWLDYQAKYDFRGTRLEDAVLSGDLRQCDFTDASIDGIKILRGKINFSQIASTASFKRRQLWRVTFRVLIEGTCDFSGIDLRGTTLFAGRDALFRDAIITDSTCTITWAQLATTKSYKEGNLSGLTLKQSDLSGADLSRQNLTGVKFAQCDFARAKLDDAVITNAQFAQVPFGDCTGLTLGQIRSTWNYKNGRMAGVVLPKEVADALLRQADSAKKE